MSNLCLHSSIFCWKTKAQRRENCVSSVLRIQKFEKVCKTYLIIIGWRQQNVCWQVAQTCKKKRRGEPAKKNRTDRQKTRWNKLKTEASFKLQTVFVCLFYLQQIQVVERCEDTLTFARVHSVRSLHFDNFRCLVAQISLYDNDNDNFVSKINKFTTRAWKR